MLDAVLARAGWPRGKASAMAAGPAAPADGCRAPLPSGWASSDLAAQPDGAVIRQPKTRHLPRCVKLRSAVWEESERCLVHQHPVQLKTVSGGLLAAPPLAQDIGVAVLPCTLEVLLAPGATVTTDGVEVLRQRLVVVPGCDDRQAES